MHVSNGGNHSYRMDSPECLLWTINFLRRKFGIPPRHWDTSKDRDRRSQGLPTFKESLLFQAFVDGTLLPGHEAVEERLPDIGANPHISTLFDPFFRDNGEEEESEEEDEASA